MQMTQAFAATVWGSESVIPDDANLEHELTNRNYTLVGVEQSAWNNASNGRVISSFAYSYPAATGGLDARGVGLDRWLLSTAAIVNLQTTTTISAGVLLTHYYNQMATVSQDVMAPNPYGPVVLTAQPPAWMPQPHRYHWYKDGVYLGEYSGQATLGAAGPNETAYFEVIVTGADASQVRGGRNVTSRDHYCEDPNALTCD
jgi:hypothetical protein